MCLRKKESCEHAEVEDNMGREHHRSAKQFPRLPEARREVHEILFGFLLKPWFKKFVFALSLVKITTT